MNSRIRITLNIFFPVLVLIIFNYFEFRIDLTEDKIYTLNTSTKKTLKKLDRPIKIDFFLNGKLPVNIVRLRRETQKLIEIMKSHTDNIIINQIYPFEYSTNSKKVVNEMSDYGLFPEFSISNKNQAIQSNIYFPWLILNDENKSVKVSLLDKKLGDDEKLKIDRSISKLEYKIMDAIYQLNQKKKKKLAVITSHKTSENIKITNLIQSIQPYYKVASFDLKAFESNTNLTLKNLKRFELIIISNPKETFSEKEKYILDQHLLSGNKQLWMINTTSVSVDSLLNLKGNSIVKENDINLDNIFFRYGIRLNKDLVKDFYCSPIVLVHGKESKSQYIPLPWPYYPVVKPIENKINRGVSSVWIKFASSIDTLKSSTKKTTILTTSDLSETVQIPNKISLNEATNKLETKNFNQSRLNIGVLISGNFNSAFQNRIKPANLIEHIDKGNSEMIVFSDGNIAENQSEKGKYIELGYDKWTNNFYENKQFLINTIHYLMDSKEILNIRNKKNNYPVLDKKLITSNKNILLYSVLLIPLLILLILGLCINKYRKTKYGQ